MLKAPSSLQLGFNDFLQKCEILEFDFDPKAIQQGRLHARDMQKFKVGAPLMCVMKCCLLGHIVFKIPRNPARQQPNTARQTSYALTVSCVPK